LFDLLSIFHFSAYLSVLQFTFIIFSNCYLILYPFFTFLVLLFSLLFFSLFFLVIVLCSFNHLSILQFTSIIFLLIVVWSFIHFSLFSPSFNFAVHVYNFFWLLFDLLAIFHISYSFIRFSFLSLYSLVIVVCSFNHLSILEFTSIIFLLSIIWSFIHFSLFSRSFNFAVHVYNFFWLLFDLLSIFHVCCSFIRSSFLSLYSLVIVVCFFNHLSILQFTSIIFLLIVVWSFIHFSLFSRSFNFAVHVYNFFWLLFDLLSIFYFSVIFVILQMVYELFYKLGIILCVAKSSRDALIWSVSVESKIQTSVILDYRWYLWMY